MIIHRNEPGQGLAGTLASLLGGDLSVAILAYDGTTPVRRTRPRRSSSGPFMFARQLNVAEVRLGFSEDTGIGSQKHESAACSSNNPGANTTTSCSTTATGSSQGSSSVCRTPATSSQTACTVFPQPTSGNHSADQANTARFTPATQKGRLRDCHPGTAYLAEPRRHACNGPRLLAAIAKHEGSGKLLIKPSR